MSYWDNRPATNTHRTTERGVTHRTAARQNTIHPATLTTACGVTTAEQGSWAAGEDVTCKRCLKRQ